MKFTGFLCNFGIRGQLLKLTTELYFWIKYHLSNRYYNRTKIELSQIVTKIK